MRGLTRFLPAFLCLLVPLGVLTFLGSRELSRQQERAESLLRGRALDFLSTAVADLDRQLAADRAALLASDPDPEHRVVALLELRERHPELLTTVRIEPPHRTFPDQGPTSLTVPFDTPSSVRRAQTANVRGDRLAAIARLEAELADATDEGEIRVRLHQRLQLAGLYRAAGRGDDARRMANELVELGHRVGERRDNRRSRRRPSWPRTDAFTLLGHTLLAEIDHDQGLGTARVVALVNKLCAGELGNVPDDLLVVLVNRLERIIADAGAAAGPPAQRAELLATLLEARAVARSFDWALGRQLANRSRQPDATNSRIEFTFDTDSTTCLLVLRNLTDTRATSPDGDAPNARGWYGFVIDLPAYIDRALGDRLEVSRTGFHLDILDDGERLLRESLPPEAEAWPADVIARCETVPGLQLAAIPRNPSAQMEDQRTSQRNRALLILALCLIAGGGALFLVRTASREAELARMKVNLVSRVSHELKTPLSMIKMYGETLALGRTKTAEQSAQFAGIISREADRLSTLIERVLDFSRSEAGQTKYSLEEHELGPIVERVIAEYRPHVEAQRAHLLATLEPGICARVDRSALAGTLVNLLENAIKYTPDESADRTIEVELTRDANTAVLAIKDRGVGVPRKERQKVFDSFYRASNAGEVRGAGLGLSLVQHFVESHQGSVEILDRTGGGSVFRLLLPTVSASAD